MQRLHAEGTLENPKEIGCRRCKTGRGRAVESLRQRDGADNRSRPSQARSGSAENLLRSRRFAFATAQMKIGDYLFLEGFCKMDAVLKIVNTINDYLSDYVLLILLVAAGLFFTIKTRFVQVRCFGEGMRRAFGGFSMHGGRQKSGLSSFQALATAIAAQVGTGNIVGACGAILIGGPGAIFWMWIIAFLGMATIYAEAVLAQDTRIVHEDGSVSGGPVYYIKRAFKGKFGKFIAGFFAVATVVSIGLIGAMVQSNSIAETCNTAFGIPTWVTGLVLAALVAVILIGGISRIASVTEKMVPVMAGLYIVGGLIVLAMRIKYVPEAFGMIFKYAFVPNALIGGSIGYALKTAISQGAKRGLFSNEAGMGSTPHAHAMANVKDPHEQGVVAMVGVFIDTFIVLTMTALVVISTLYAGNGVLASGAAPDGVAKTNMAQMAFSMVFGDKVGNGFVAVCLFFFAFSTILGWNLFGKLNIEYLFGKKAVVVFSVIAVVFVFLGTLSGNDLVWALMDLFNYMMVLPNVPALIALSGLVATSALAHGRKKAAAGKE